MGLRSLGFLCLLFCMNLGCYPVDETEPENEIDIDVVEEPEPSPPPPAGTSGQQKENPSSPLDEGFDPCPSDTYIFELDDGTVMMFEIEVFCDPRPYINMGCPGPEM